MLYNIEHKSIFLVITLILLTACGNSQFKYNPIESFDINHEKLMHLIVVSEDLSYFNHIHPEYKDNGLFDIRTQFPYGGEYKLFADFIPSGGSELTKSKTIKIDGEEAEQVDIVPDRQLTKSVDGLEVTLLYDELKVGEEVTLKFTIKDDKTKKPINNLVPSERNL